MELQRFFEDAVRRSLGDLARRDDPAAGYLADLLTRFSRTTRTIRSSASPSDDRAVPGAARRGARRPRDGDRATERALAGRARRRPAGARPRPRRGRAPAPHGPPRARSRRGPAGRAARALSPLPGRCPGAGARGAPGPRAPAGAAAAGVDA